MSEPIARMTLVSARYGVIVEVCGHLSMVTPLATWTECAVQPWLELPMLPVNPPPLSWMSLNRGAAGNAESLVASSVTWPIIVMILNRRGGGGPLGSTARGGMANV